jgi:MFS family permease
LAAAESFLIGATIFTVFSVLAGLATDTWMLIIARGVMGVGGAMMWPAVLGMTYSLLPSGREALGGSLIMTAAGMGNAVGPLLGGALTDLASWRLIFLLNLPVTLIAMLVTWRVVAVDEVHRARFMPPGTE